MDYRKALEDAGLTVSDCEPENEYRVTANVKYAWCAGHGTNRKEAEANLYGQCLTVFLDALESQAIPFNAAIASLRNLKERPDV